jgi:hypothetical protein
MRLPALTELTPRQQEISDAIAAKRGATRGPFLIWLRSPELAEKVDALGAYCRFDAGINALPGRARLRQGRSGGCRAVTRLTESRRRRGHARADAGTPQGSRPHTGQTATAHRLVADSGPSRPREAPT